MNFRPKIPHVAVALFLGVLAAACGGSGTPVPIMTTTPTSAPAQATPVPDDSFPDFELPKAGGGTLKFSDYRGKQPLNVVFYRGYF